MFRKNEQHLQRPLFSTLDELSPALRERLESSWAGVFRREVFQRIDETPFAVLYSSQESRPNVPVNVLLSLEVLKAGFGWTDEELYDHFAFDLQVRYAVGYENLSDGSFSIRTLYGFRQRLARHMQETGENLVEVAFAQVTDEQIQALGVRTTHLRMDSTQVASNIRRYSRMQLLVEVLHRVYRALSEADRENYQALFAPYVQGKSGHFVYTLKPEEYDTHLQAIGQVMAQLLAALASGYGHTPAYALLARVFAEHFVWEEAEQRPKRPEELAATSLQAPDDPEATFRRKQGEPYRGYVTNLTETCHPDNETQLIVKVHTEPNVADDAHMLAQEVPDLVQRTDVETLYTDGGYNSAEVDALLDEHHIRHVQTALRGGKPDPDGLSLVDFHFETGPEGEPVAATCPAGQRFGMESGRVAGRFIGRPDADICQACPLWDRCPVRPRSGRVTPALYLSQRDVRVVRKRQAIAAMAGAGNPRAAVEATIRAVKHPLDRGRLRVRGLFRVACQMIGSAMMVNLRRIHKAQLNRPLAPLWVFLVGLLTCVDRLRRPFTWFKRQMVPFARPEEHFALPLVDRPFLLSLSG
ncbi:MAG: hypothetical protein KatS3mg051_1893 [Anaerolineae bacterium]|nr:MAG: hypothetical protein KatS3mg051_1893 [Anaerolineae bacterium]